MVLEPPPALERRTRHVLVVEDDLATGDALVVVLQAEGYETSIARNGREALDRLNETNAPDLILLDLRMPVMDGWSFRNAQRRSSALAPIPVIAMSADGTSQAAAISADAFLEKPLDMPDLLETVERVLAKSDRRKEAEHWTRVERMSSLGQVAAGVGHEINNPLAFVLMNVTHVRDELREAVDAPGPSQQLVELLDESLLGLERIRDIVQNVQTLSRTPDERREPLRLDKLVDDSITVARSHLLRARVKRRYADVPLVMGSAGALGQVFLNLLINAAQALPEGDTSKNEISATIAFDGTEVVVEIADTGRGIPAEILPRIFDPFFTTKGSLEGTGLGLSICQRIVTAHGGTLTIESEVGRGTIARVSLKPTRVVPQAPAPRLVEPGTPGPTRRGRVLVIDDEPMIGAVIARRLSRDHDVVFVQEAAEAFAMLELGREFDVVLCDLTMPTMSGPEVLDALVSRAPALASHMIFMTGGAFTERASAYLRETNRPVLYKPFTAADLAAVIAEQLEPAAGK